MTHVYSFHSAFVQTFEIFNALNDPTEKPNREHADQMDASYVVGTKNSIEKIRKTISPNDWRKIRIHSSYSL